MTTKKFIQTLKGFPRPNLKDYKFVADYMKDLCDWEKDNRDASHSKKADRDTNHSKTVAAKLLNKTIVPINEKETHALYDGNWEEILKHQDGSPYIHAANHSSMSIIIVKPTPSIEEGELKCTPGIWKVYKNMVLVQGRKHNSICTVHIQKAWDELSRPIHDHEQDANANLIAASKEMYYAIQRLLKEFDNPDNHAHQRGAVEEAKEALNQAIGKQ